MCNYAANKHALLCVFVILQFYYFQHVSMCVASIVLYDKLLFCLTPGGLSQEPGQVRDGGVKSGGGGGPPANLFANAIFHFAVVCHCCISSVLSCLFFLSQMKSLAERLLFSMTARCGLARVLCFYC